MKLLYRAPAGTTSPRAVLVQKGLSSTAAESERASRNSAFRTAPVASLHRFFIKASATCGILALCVAPSAHAQRHYLQTNLVSDVAGWAAVTDPHLVNAWGLSRSATSPW